MRLRNFVCQNICAGARSTCPIRSIAPVHTPARALHVCGPRLQQIGQMFSFERHAAAQLPHHQAYLRKVLHRLHLHQRIHQRLAICHHAMVRQQHCIVVLQVGRKRLPHLAGSRSRIWRQRNRAQRHHHLRAERLVQRKSA